LQNFEGIAKKLRRHILEMTTEASSGHPGGSLSAVEIVAALYFSKMRHDPKNPKWADRDRFVLSKGHAAPLLYAALAESGYFPIRELKTLRGISSRLEGHPDMNKVPGVDISTGSLGQGISAAVGMALAGKLDKKDYQVYALLGDGETQEGEVWEAAMSAAHYKLDNLTAFIDRNKLQISGDVEKVMSIEPAADKWRAFGWNVLEINGHDTAQIFNAIEQAKNTKGKPTIILADTIKGKGVSFMEGVYGYHGKALTKEQLAQALKELDQ